MSMKRGERRSPRRRTRSVHIVVALLIGGGLCVCTTKMMALEPAVSDDDLVIVTEDEATGAYGCDAISIFSTSDTQPLRRGPKHVSPGRLAATTDLSRIIAVNSNLGDLNDPFLYLTEREAPGARKWGAERFIGGANFHFNGGIAIAPDNDTLLVATTPHRPNYIARPGPVSIQKYRLSEIVGNHIGPSLGQFVAPSPVFEILIDADGKNAHLLTVSGELHTLDVATMKETEAAIIGVPPRVDGFSMGEAPTEYFHAAMSPDGQRVVVNLWQARGLTVFELKLRTAHFIELPAAYVGGVAFNHAWVNFGLLAVHLINRISLFSFSAPSELIQISDVSITQPNTPGRGAEQVVGPLASIAWSGDGAHIIAATDVGLAEFALFDVSAGGTRLLPQQRLIACAEARVNLPNDILTTNRLRPPTATPSPTLTSSPTVPSSPTSSPTASPAPSLTATPSPPLTATPSPTVTATPTHAPAPIYLPVSLRERCVPGERHIDIALVLDASTSMLERTSAGRTKLEAATDAARALLEMLRLDVGDRAAVVTFNADAALLAPLSSDLAVLEAALGRIAVAQQTRIDLGIQVAAGELSSARHAPGHTPVMIVLTDGRANPVPADVAVGNAAAAKAAGIVVHTVGVGSDLDVEALRAMASSAATFHLAPDAEQLAEIYRAIAVALPCAGRYWPGHP